MNLDLLQLTIVILSKDRNDYLRSAINFYSQYGMNTIVVHNCSLPLDSDEIPNQCMYLPSKLSIAERCMQAASNLNSKFVILISDDEFLIPEALNRIVFKMEKNENLFSAGGQAIGLNEYNNRLTGVLAYSSLREYSNVNDSLFERVDYHVKQNSGNRALGSIYRVMRSDVFKNIALAWAKTIDRFSCKYTFEIIADVYLNIFGKAEYIDEIYWCRNWVNAPVLDDSVMRELYFHLWWEREEYEIEKKSFIEILFPDFKEIMTLEEFSKILDKFYEGTKPLELGELNHLENRLTLGIFFKKLKIKIHLVFWKFKKISSEDTVEIFRYLDRERISYNTRQLSAALSEFKRINLR